jgi:hypothetical protein
MLPSPPASPAPPEKLAPPDQEQDGPPARLAEGSEDSAVDSTISPPTADGICDPDSLGTIDALIDEHGEVGFCHKLRIGKEQLTLPDQALLARLLKEAVDGCSHNGDQ